MDAAFFLPLVDPHSAPIARFQDVSRKRMQTPLCLARLHNVVGKSEGEEAHVLDAEVLAHRRYVALQRKGCSAARRRKIKRFFVVLG